MSSMQRRIAADCGGVYAINGLIAFSFAATGPVAIILAVGAQGGLAESAPADRGVDCNACAWGRCTTTTTMT